MIEASDLLVYILYAFELVALLAFFAVVVGQFARRNAVSGDIQKAGERMGIVVQLCMLIVVICLFVITFLVLWFDKLNPETQELFVALIQ